MHLAVKCLETLFSSRNSVSKHHAMDEKDGRWNRVKSPNGKTKDEKEV